MLTATLPAPTLTPTAVATTTPATTPTQPAPSPTPTSAGQIETEVITYSGAFSVEDLNTLILDIRTLSGIRDVQGGAQTLQVTYDLEQVSRQEIIDVIESHGYTVEEE